MRALVFFCLIAGPFGLAAAHLPPDQTNIAGQVGHLLVSGHHLPLALLILVALVFIRRGRPATSRRR